MVFIKRLGMVILVVLLVGFGSWIGIDNQTPVTFCLLGFSLGELPLGLWMLSSLCIGIFFGLLVTVPTVFRLRRKNLSLFKKLQKLNSSGVRVDQGR